MKLVILAGGMGTRIVEESSFRPKPLVEIGGMPILWHIMKIYSAFDVHEFIICCGYKGYMIKEFFSNYYLHYADVTFDMAKNSMEVHQCSAEPWRVTLVSTGETTQTGGRLKRVQSYLADEEAFCLTYGDGVGNVDIDALLRFHRQEGVLATLTAVQPQGRFGALEMDRQHVTAFKEKPKGDGSWINGGFFVLSPKVFDLIEGDQTLFVRRDEVEAQWDWIDAIRTVWDAGGLAAKPYPAGTWGPTSAIALAERDGVTWHE